MRPHLLHLLLALSLAWAAWGLASWVLPWLPAPPGGVAVAVICLVMALPWFVLLRRREAVGGSDVVTRTQTPRAPLEQTSAWESAVVLAHHSPGRSRAQHAWLDVDRGRHVQARIAFELPDEVPQAALRKATTKGMRAAVSALPARGKVAARGSWEDVPGPMARVRVALDVRGHGADEAWARAAAGAFEGAFLAHLEKRGWPARRKS